MTPERMVAKLLTEALEAARRVTDWKRVSGPEHAPEGSDGRFFQGSTGARPMSSYTESWRFVICDWAVPVDLLELLKPGAKPQRGYEGTVAYSGLLAPIVMRLPRELVERIFQLALAATKV